MKLNLKDCFQIEVTPVPAGSVQIGSDNEVFSEAPRHPVTISSAFFMGTFPVTQMQWDCVMADNPSAFRAPDHPVDSVSWDHAISFCRRVSEKSGRNVRLPSEAEWEYACRAGTPSEFFFGAWGPFRDDSEVPPDLQRLLCCYSWFDLNSNDQTRAVGMKKPNPWGLHDMLGNVWEWCADVWHSNYLGAPTDGSAWISGEDTQPRRCLRGGAWDMNAFRCRSCYRSFDHRDLGTDRFGFRVVVDGSG